MVAKDSKYGSLSPWAWAIEPVRGCNLRCGHCAIRAFESDELEYMSDEVWIDTFRLINAVTPLCRVEMSNAGEPTLHPRLLELLKIGRKLAPRAQFQMTTNGTMIEKGKITYKQLFNAGMNILYVDMYAPKERHIELAEQSGYLWYEYLDHDIDVPNAWAYHGPHMQFITLMEPPHNWPKKRLSLGRLGTFYNHMDWKAAEKFNMFPVTEPIAKTCSQPFKYISLKQDGYYEFCCQDFFGETAGKLGHVSEGVPGFERYWFGPFMQLHRKHLLDKDRAWSKYCSRCNITFNIGPGMARRMKDWKQSALKFYWEDEEWQRLDEHEDYA